MTHLNHLQELILSEYGLVPRDSWKTEIASSVEALAQEQGITKQEFVDHVLRDRLALQELAGRLTIEESFFFRHFEHHQIFIDYIRRRLRSDEEKEIIIWSAGCSDGQEPFTIAIALREQFSEFDCSRISIIATDLSAASIDNAGQGIYPEWSFRGMNDSRRNEFFKKTGPDRFKIRSDIRQMVDFRCLPILEHGKQFALSSIDCVFFRNVAIYLSKEAQSELCRLFSQILVKKGLLFLAPSDLLPTNKLFAWRNKDLTSVLVPIEKPSPLNTHSMRRKSSRIPNQARRFSSAIPSPITNHPRAGFDPARALTHDGAQPGLRSGSAAEYARRALSMADRGDFTKAISISNTLIEQQPHNKLGYLVRGQVYLADDNYKKAIGDLRRAIFIDPNDNVVRFWYAYGLQKCGAAKRSLVQVNSLLAQLSALKQKTLLEDGNTTAGELLKAAQQMKENLI